MKQFKVFLMSLLAFFALSACGDKDPPKEDCDCGCECKDGVCTECDCEECKDGKCPCHDDGGSGGEGTDGGGGNGDGGCPDGACPPPGEG